VDSRYPHALRGIGLMLLAVSCFGCLDTLSKLLVAHYPAPAIVWARYVLQTVVMVAMFAPRMGLRLVRTANPALQIVRGVFLTASSVVFVVALGYLPIAEVSAITFMAPIIVALAAGPLLGERLNPRTWIALAGGFAGVLMIIKPGSAVFAWAALLPLACAFFVAAYQILTRKLAGRDDPITTLFYPGLIGVIVLPAFPSALIFPTQPLHAAMIAVLGLFGAVGHFLLIKAHNLAPASLLAPFSYVQLLVVLVLGWLIFGQLPDGLTLAGMVLVVGSGLMVVLVNRPRRAAAK
jgi:drug/metabolite transporter (DMT)-like permease